VTNLKSDLIYLRKKIETENQIKPKKKELILWDNQNRYLKNASFLFIRKF